MLKYIAKRIGLALITIFTVATLTFFLMNMVPGGPFLSEKAVSPAAQAALEAKYGLDKPLSQQYLTYMKDALHGDFGESLKQRGRTVTSIIVSKFPVSARVGGLSVIVALLVGIPLGCLAATNGCLGCQLGFAAFTAAYIAERYLPSYCLLFTLMLLYPCCP